MSADDVELVEVRILELPVEIFVRTSEYTDGLLREFALIQARPGTAPAQLLALSTETRQRFSGFTAAPASTLAAAVDRHDLAIDLAYELPRTVGEVARRLRKLLDEADEYCRAEQLLTLEPDQDVIAFRRWFLGEFTAQAEGAAPTSWPDWVRTPR